MSTGEHRENLRRWRFTVLLVLLAGLAPLIWRTGRGQGARPAAPAYAALDLTPLPHALGTGEAGARSSMQSALAQWAAGRSGGVSLRLGAIWGEASWAAGEVEVDLAGPGGTEGTLALAQRRGDGWQAALPGDAAFPAFLQAGPAGYLPPAALDWFLAESGALVSDTQGLYYLPYTAGTSVLITCVDCYSGHFPSIDLYTWGDLTLRAARDGTVAAWKDVGDLCCCQSGCSACSSYLVLDHGDGEYSAYLHLASGSIPPAFHQAGAFVPRGAAIGQEGDVGYTCGSSRPALGCGPVTPTPGQGCGRNLHFEVRDAPFPQGNRLRPRFLDVYNQTDPHTYYPEQDKTYVSGNTPVTPPTPTPTPTPCPRPTAPPGVYLFSEARYCGYYDRFTAPAQDLDGTTVISDGVRSLSVAGPYSVTLYPDRDFAGLPALVLGDVPDLGGTTIGTRTASLRVEPFTPTLPLANDGRAFPFTLTLGLSPTGYLQDLSASTSVPEDPIPSCLESRGEHTLWYRPLLREPAVVTVHLAGPGDAVLALWQEGPAGLQELACARAGGAGLRLVLPAGVPLLLEAAGRDGPSGTLSLVVWREPAWSVYLPLVLRGHRT